MYFSWVSAVPAITLLALPTWSVWISFEYRTRQCFWMKLCPKALPWSRLGWGSGPSCELLVTWEVTLARFALHSSSSAPSCLPHARSASWVSAAVRRGLPRPLPSNAGGRLCAHTPSKSGARGAARSGRMQVAGVGVCSRWRWCWVTANQDDFLLPRAGPSWAALRASHRWDRFSVLTRCRDVRQAVGRSGWNGVTSSSLPWQDGGDGRGVSCTPSLLSRWGVFGGTWCVVILWEAGSLRLDPFCTLNTDQSYTLLYRSSKFVPELFIFLLFKPYSYECSMWSGPWRRKLILSQFNVRYSAYFKPSVYKMFSLFLLPWQAGL